MENLISIIIVNWNGKKWLKKCLNSLYAQTYKNFEIIFVDNASSDGSVEFVKSNFPNVVVIENKKNLGFAGGNNVGLKKAKGEYLLLLNNDTWVEENYLRNFVRAFAEIPNLGSAQSKIVLMNDPKKLDACGAYWTRSSFLYHYGYGKDQSLEKYNKAMPFFSNKGASMLIRKDLVDKIDLFDDDFWCYYEETDFCHRLWLAGYECWYWPEAKVYHALGGTSLRVDNSYVQYHNFKNKLLSFIKNFELKTLLTTIPIYLALNIIISVSWLLQGKLKHFLALYKAMWWNLFHLKATLRKRFRIQSQRVIPDREVLKKTKIDPRFSYYLYLLSNKLEKYAE